MEDFSEEHSKLLLSKEWLVKVDAQTSKPYLFKFYSSSVDLTCCFVITDTKKTWAEVLNSNQFARRWRECNERISSPFRMTTRKRHGEHAISRCCPGRIP
ncbi:hypothetical protein EDD15DRAFT_884774 [Pisolithus albus]|nr:hypothetical protein EDD15DRAFT_884774 [Pisolithus albus]